MKGGAQTLSLGDHCYEEWIIIHEFMHALGVEHYHNRPDRDEYVDIYWGNIKPGWKSQYTIESDSWTYDTPYDLESFMHYGIGTVSQTTIDHTKPGMEPKVYT